MIARAAAALLVLCVSAPAFAQDAKKPSPEAPGRTYGQNYKDLVLSLCLATAYKDDPKAAADAAGSFAGLRDWTYYDLENSPDEIKGLVDSYLARDYANPLAEPEAKGARFDLLKCLDLYHSQALADQVKRFVPEPDKTFRSDHQKP